MIPLYMALISFALVGAVLRALVRLFEETVIRVCAKLSGTLESRLSYFLDR